MSVFQNYEFFRNVLLHFYCRINFGLDDVLYEKKKIWGKLDSNSTTKRLSNNRLESNQVYDI